MIHVGDRGIYSSICADAARRFAGEKCGEKVVFGEKRSLLMIYFSKVCFLVFAVEMKWGKGGP